MTVQQNVEYARNPVSSAKVRLAMPSEHHWAIALTHRTVSDILFGTVVESFAVEIPVWLLAGPSEG